MPIKLKPSIKKVDRRTGKVSVVHYYIKGTSEKDLMDMSKDENTRPKLRSKILAELTRRNGLKKNLVNTVPKTN